MKKLVIRKTLGGRNQHKSLIQRVEMTPETSDNLKEIASLFNKGTSLEEKIANLIVFFEEELLVRGLPIVPLIISLPQDAIKRQQLAEEFMRKHKISSVYAKSLVHLFCGDIFTTKVKDIPTFVEALASDDEAAKYAADALQKLIYARSELEAGRASAAMGKLLDVIALMHLFTVSNMQLRYLIGKTKGDVSALNNEDKTAFAEIWHKEAYEIFLVKEKEKPLQPKRNWKSLAYSEIADVLRVKYASELSQLSFELSEVRVADVIRKAIRESKRKV